MNLAFAAAAAVLFGTGAALLLSRDLVRVVAGIMLNSQCAVLTLLASSLSRGQAPIAPLAGEVSDPLPQALALTALVIGLATVAVLLALVHRVSVAARSAAVSELSAAEHRHDETLDADRGLDADEAA